MRDIKTILLLIILSFIGITMSAKQPYDELSASSGKPYAERYPLIKEEIKAGRANDNIDRLLIASMYANSHDEQLFADSCVNLALDAGLAVNNLDRYHRYNENGIVVWFMPKVVAALTNDAFLGIRQSGDSNNPEEMVSRPATVPIDSTLTHYVEIYQPDMLPLCKLSNMRVNQGDAKALAQALQQYREAYQVLTTKDNSYSDEVALAILYRYLKYALDEIEYNKVQDETVHHIPSDAYVRKIALLGEYQNYTIQNYTEMDSELALAVADLAEELKFDKLADFYVYKAFAGKSPADLHRELHSRIVSRNKRAFLDNPFADAGLTQYRLNQIFDHIDGNRVVEAMLLSNELLEKYPQEDEEFEWPKEDEYTRTNELDALTSRIIETALGYVTADEYTTFDLFAKAASANSVIYFPESNKSAVEVLMWIKSVLKDETTADAVETLMLCDYGLAYNDAHGLDKPKKALKWYDTLVKYATNTKLSSDLRATIYNYYAHVYRKLDNAAKANECDKEYQSILNQENELY